MPNGSLPETPEHSPGNSKGLALFLPGIVCDATLFWEGIKDASPQGQRIGSSLVH